MTVSVARVFKAIDAVNEASAPVSVTDLANKLGVPGGTVFRNLDALERTGYVSRYQSSSRYVLGPVAKRLRRSVFLQFKIRELAIPFLRQLSMMTGETTALLVPIGYYGARIAVSRGNNEVIASATTGDIRMLHRGSASRVILAGFTADDLQAYAAWAAIREPSWSPAAVQSEFDAIRTHGYTTQILTDARGFSSIAFRVQADSRTVAAIAIEGPVISPDNQSVAPSLELWTSVIREIEALLEKNPSLSENPFGHIDPTEISFRSVDAPR